MQLTSVSIEGFRSIEQAQEVPVGSPTILAGHNDAGKSAVIEAIAYLLNSYKLTDRDRTFGPPGPEGVPTRIPETVVQGTFELSSTEQQSLGLPATCKIRRIARDTGESLEVLTDEPTNDLLRDIDAQVVPALRHRLTSLGAPSDGLKPDLVARLHALASTALKTAVWTSAAPEVRRALPRAQKFDATSSQDPEQAILAALRSSYKAHLSDDGLKGDVEKITTELEKRVLADAKELREHIKRKCSDIGDVTITPEISWDSGLKSTEISARNDRGEEVHLGQSGAGRARRIALAVWEHNSEILGTSGEETVLLYDEPDTHLDYRHQRGFMKLLLEQAALPNVRIVVASHSMNLIDGVDISNVLHLRHVESRTKIDKITDDSETGRHLGAIATSLGLRNTVLLHERLFVGVEGDTESRAFPVLFKLATGRHLESCGIAIWPCNNNDGALRFAQYLNSHDRNVIMVVDHDSLELKLFSDASLRRHDLVPAQHLLTIGTREFEDVFDDDQWADCANSNWPRRDGSVWTTKHFNDHRGTKFSSNVERMIHADSDTKMSGKPDMMVTFALHLKSRDEIPQILLDVFDDLIERAD